MWRPAYSSTHAMEPVVAGGEVTVGRAVVSHGGLTLTVGTTDGAQPAPGVVRVTPGATVQDVAAALDGVGAPPTAIAAIFESLLGWERSTTR